MGSLGAESEWFNLVFTCNLISSVTKKYCELIYHSYFSFDPSPFARLTFWIVIFGNFFHWTAAISANQAMVQKFLSLPSLEKAKR